MIVYRGFELYIIVDGINITNVSELIVSFYDGIAENFTWNPGIVLYNGNNNCEIYIL